MIDTRVLFTLYIVMCDVRALCGGAPPPYALPNTAGVAGQSMVWPASPGTPLQLTWGSGGYTPVPGETGVTLTFTASGTATGGPQTMLGDYLQSGPLVTFAAVNVGGTQITFADSGSWGDTGAAIPAGLRPVRDTYAAVQLEDGGGNFYSGVAHISGLGHIQVYLTNPAAITGLPLAMTIVPFTITWSTLVSRSIEAPARKLTAKPPTKPAAK